MNLLPSEVRALVLAPLNAVDQAAAACVCRSWRDAVRSEGIVRRLDDELRRVVTLAITSEAGLLGQPLAVPSCLAGFQWRVCGLTGDRTVSFCGTGGTWMFGDVFCGPPSIAHYPGYRGEYSQRGFLPRTFFRLEDYHGAAAEKYWRHRALSPIRLLFDR
jgi:hypothetical protein